MKKKYFRAFTLVELIIVITILAILATIAFVSFSNYTKSAKDSVRLVNLSNISKQLDSYFVQKGKYPVLTTYQTIHSSGEVLHYQGEIEKNVLGLIQVSPDFLKTGDKYYYSYIPSGKKYQLSTTLDQLGTYFGTEVYAETQKRVKNIGENVGLVTDSNYELFSASDIDISTGSTLRVVSFPGNVEFNGTGSVIFSQVYNRRSDLLIDSSLAKSDPFLKGYWDMESVFLSGGSNYLKDFSQYGNHGILVGGITIGGAQGVDGKATVFDGVNDYISLGKIFSGSISQFSLISRVKFNKINERTSCSPDSNLYTPILSSWQTYAGGTNEQGLRFGINSNCLGETRFYNNVMNINIGRAASYDTKNYSDFSSQYTGKFLDLALIFNNGSLDFYVNGDKKSVVLTGSGTPILMDGKDNMALGYSYVNYGLLNGTIDEVKIYNRALSNEEILQQVKVTGY